MAVVDDGGGIPGPGQSGSAESSGSSAPLFELLVMLPGQLCWHQRRLVSSTEKNERRTNGKNETKAAGNRKRKKDAHDEGDPFESDDPDMPLYGMSGRGPSMAAEPSRHE